MLRVASFITFIATCAVATAMAQEPSQSQNQVPTIVTSGEATLQRAPDQAFVTLSVETRAKTPKEAQQLNADAMTAIQARITRLNIARDRVRTTGYSVQQEFDFPNGRRTARGYVTRNGVEVRIEPVERVGEFLDAMVDAGATTVSQVRFDLKDRNAAESEALRLAVVDARAHADAIAAGAGRTIDRVMRITETPQPRFRMAQPMMAERSLAASAEPTPIEPGTIEIHAQVELTATFK